jgi:catechol 2,3-dioxygenase-like lactoylglutathione lyase family enzyme
MARIRNLRHLSIETVDVDAVREFSTSFGLDVTERGEHLVLRCEGRDQDQILVREGRHRQIHHVEFGVDPGSLDEMARQIEKAGVALVDAPEGEDPSGLWLHDPDGNLLHLVDAEPAPAAPPPYFATNQAGRSERVDVAMWELLPTQATPRRLMHCLAFVSDQDRSEQFYIGVLGLRLSDRIQGKATFLNGTTGDHHIFGLVTADGPGLHHAAWEVDTVDTIAVGAEQMARNGWTDGWGFGRHNLGSNFFHYFRGPHNLWFEYSCDIDQVTEKWVGKEQHVKPWAWGPPAPQDFTDNDAFARA